ncbi:dephospho-CoA kinase [Dactylosporangium sp. NPDC051541]|uniref:dephospho-CoA kinase n=1 Tax=Dactylosporangium sp. NPDC051541 TaxID=3363977 RepID=UPI0037AF1464
MKMVGLTGGIGAGKSAVAQRLAALGAVVIDADRLAREVVEPGTEGLARIVETFGPGVLDPSGALDRAALAKIVFANDDARRRLEEITHPLVRARTAELIEAAPPGSIIVNDVPLIVEKGMSRLYSLVLIVFAALDTRLDRLTRLRGMSRDEALARINAQATDEQRRAVADIAITNDGTPEDLDREVARAWERIVAS